MPVSLVCCGLIGTMVTDGGMVDRAFAEAIGTQGVVTGTAAYARCMAQVHQRRGEPAADVMQAVFPDSQARGQAAYLALDRSLCDAIGRIGVSPVPGAAAAIEKLAAAGIRICVITSFSRRVLNLVLEALGWLDRIDLALSPEDVPRGAPWPDLVLAAMLRLGVTDVRETAVAHDTDKRHPVRAASRRRDRRGGADRTAQRGPAPPGRRHPPDPQRRAPARVADRRRGRGTRLGGRSPRRRQPARRRGCRRQPACVSTEGGAARGGRSRAPPAGSRWRR